MANQRLEVYVVEDLLKIRDEVNAMLSRKAEALREELASIDGDFGKGSGVPANDKETAGAEGRAEVPRSKDRRNLERTGSRRPVDRSLRKGRKEARRVLVKNRQSAPKRRKNKSARRRPGARNNKSIHAVPHRLLSHAPL